MRGAGQADRAFGRDPEPSSGPCPFVAGTDNEPPARRGSTRSSGTHPQAFKGPTVCGAQLVEIAAVGRQDPLRALDVGEPHERGVGKIDVVLDCLMYDCTTADAE